MATAPPSASNISLSNFLNITLISNISKYNIYDLGGQTLFNLLIHHVSKTIPRLSIDSLVLERIV